MSISADQLIAASKDVTQYVTLMMSTSADQLTAAGKDCRSAGDFSDEYISGLLDISADLSLSADPSRTLLKKHANLCFDSFGKAVIGDTRQKFACAIFYIHS